MKLKTKICMITIAVITAAMVFFCILILNLAKRSNLNAAISAEKATAEVVYNNVSNKFNNIVGDEESEIVRDTILRSIGNESHEKSIILTNHKTNECLYNRTEYNPMSVLNAKSQNKFTYCIVKVEGRDVLYLGRTLTEDKIYQFYIFKDISYVYQNIHSMAGYMLTVGIITIVLVGAIVMLLLRKVLRSLNVLKEGTKNVADGHYDTKIVVKSKDEFHDLADRFNEMSDAVNEHVLQLQEEAENRKMLISALTHELKTPITSIKGYSQTLIITKLPQEQQEDLLQTIDTECSRLERLSQKMMGLIMMINQNELETKETELSELLNRLEKNTKAVLEQDQIVLKVENHMDKVLVEPDLFLELLINLVDNSRKASKPGDIIEVIAMNGQIQIKDHGKGIPKEELKKIMQPFYMVDKSRNRKKNGLGLGLALCDRIVTLHGAQLKYDSELGEGTTVTITLPM